MQPPSGPSLSHRATLALSLWAGFYLLAFGMAGGLLFAAYAVFAFSRSPSLFLIFCGIGAIYGAAMILWSSFPRWQRFKAPGPKLDPKKHQRLFEEIRRIARDTRQKPPSEVYLSADVNAWVTVRGGLFGLFSRRVMAVGLPLLRILTLSQFRSVLVHEFGHYVGGDTRLGAWIWKTYAAIQRTLEALEGNDSIWRFPFVAYAKWFTRLALQSSRQQELAADALAAKIAGANAAAEALRRIEAAANAYPSFVSDEFLPVLKAEFRPSLCDGFVRYMESKEVSRFVLRRLGRELSDRKRDPYRTHPPLPERLEAMAKLPPGFEVREDPPAIELLADLDQCEKDVVAFVTSDPKVAALPPLAWSEAGEKAFLPQWREQAKIARPHLKGIAPESFPELALTELGSRIEKSTTDAVARSIAAQALGATLLVSLRDLGWTIDCEPGDRPAVIRENERVEPLHIFLDLAEGKLTRDAWRAKCKSGGFEGLNLGPVDPTG
ncbi:MAG TPA: M48 family metallopeptidase [Planctomycetota bacterium]|nr:M48 family metallopeptidase [Planctomycetota bacterium]